MNVNDIMTRSVRTVSPETRLLEVASLMCLYRISGLPVVDQDKLVGFIAERDLLHRLFPTLEDLIQDRASVNLDELMAKYKDVVKLQVADVMIHKVITVSPEMHILKAASLMAGKHFRRIPVAEDGRLVGMLSLGDVHKAIFQANLTDTFASR